MRGFSDGHTIQLKHRIHSMQHDVDWLPVLIHVLVGLLPPPKLLAKVSI